LAVDCLPPPFIEGLLYWRNQPLELGEAAAIYEPTETLTFVAAFH